MVKPIKVREMAERLNCHPRTVQRMLREGQIPGVRVRRTWRIDPDAAAIALSNGPKPKK